MGDTRRAGGPFLGAAALLLAACAAPAEPPARTRAAPVGDAPGERTRLVERPPAPREAPPLPAVATAGTGAADLLLALPTEMAGLLSRRRVAALSWSDLGPGAGASLTFGGDGPGRPIADVELLDPPPGTAAPADGVEDPLVARVLELGRAEVAALAGRVPVSPAMPVPDIVDASGAPVLRCYGYHMGGHLPEEPPTVLSVARCAGAVGGRVLRLGMNRPLVPLRYAREPPPAPEAFGRALVAALRGAGGR